MNKTLLTEAVARLGSEYIVVGGSKIQAITTGKIYGPFEGMTVDEVVKTVESSNQLLFG